MGEQILLIDENEINAERSGEWRIPKGEIEMSHHISIMIAIEFEKYFRKGFETWKQNLSGVFFLPVKVEWAIAFLRQTPKKTYGF